MQVDCKLPFFRDKREQHVCTHVIQYESNDLILNHMCTDILGEQREPSNMNAVNIAGCFKKKALLAVLSLIENIRKSIG